MKKGRFYLTEFSKGFIEMMAEKKIATDKNILRDYDILKDNERGLSLSQLAIKYGLHRDTIKLVVSKHRK